MYILYISCNKGNNKYTRTHTHTYIYNNNFTQDGNTYIQKLNMSSPRGIAQNLRMVASNASLGTRMHGGTTEKEQRRNMEELNRMEVSIKHTGLKLDPVQAKKVASALLENTSILRFTYDRLHRQANHIIHQIKQNTF